MKLLGTLINLVVFLVLVVLLSITILVASLTKLLKCIIHIFTPLGATNCYCLSYFQSILETLKDLVDRILLSSRLWLIFRLIEQILLNGFEILEDY